jgi:hypothetical protein
VRLRGVRSKAGVRLRRCWVEGGIVGLKSSQPIARTNTHVHKFELDQGYSSKPTSPAAAQRLRISLQILQPPVTGNIVLVCTADGISVSVPPWMALGSGFRFVASELMGLSLR